MSRLRSLRWRLTLAYVALLAILLSALAVYQYASLRNSLINARVESMHDDATTGVGVFRNTGLDRVGNANPLQRLATVISTVAGHTVSVALYSTSGTELATVRSDPDASGTLPRLSTAQIRTAAAGATVDTVLPGPTGPELVAGFPLGATARNERGVVQMSVPMTSINTVLGRELVVLLVGSGIALVTALVMGLALTGGALRPLRRLTVTADELAAGDLRARSRLEPRPDEVGHLTAAFDHMADRIEAAFTAQTESEAKVRRFIADASHELRTPVTALKGYIDVMRRGAGRDPATLDTTLDSMSREAERMRGLVLDLLTLARLDAGTTAPVEVVDLRETVGRLLDEGIPGMPAQLDRGFPDAAVMVRCQPEALVTIVRNLMVNACKYAPGARQEWLISVRDGMARLDAHDDGPGIPAADLPHVFERFYRGEKTRTRQEGGSGLGLAIVDGLARAQGGRASVASTEGVGTTVSIFLPVA
jgi:two-component system OmpR family sensor kinase